MTKSITQKTTTKQEQNLKNYFLSCATQIKYFTFLFILLFSSMGWGQTNPTPFDLSTGSFTFASQTATSTTYPTNMQGWATSANNISTAETTIPSTDQSLVASGTSSTSGLSNLGANGFQFLSTSSSPNRKVGSLCVALNTSGRQNILINWTAQDMTSSSSGTTMGMSFQYRIGTTGVFTDFGASTLYQTLSTSQNSGQTYTNITLPVICENSPIIQIRWIYYQIGTTGTSRDAIRLDDITVSSSSMPACSGTPAPGNTLASINPVGSGSSTVLSLQNATAGTGVTYQWKSSTDNVTYTSISVATNATYTATPSAATYYVCDVTCSGVTTTSNPVQVTLTYCTPISSSSSTYFSGFTTSGGATNISNNATVFSSGGYVNYSSSMAVSQFATGTINFSATIVGGTAGIAIFVDYNNDFDFTDVGETVYNSAAYLPTGTTNSSFVIPSGTVVGNYRMRIITDYNVGTPTSCSFASGSRGEIEDYTLTVVAQPSCMIPTALASSAISYQAATIGWTAPASGTSPAGYEYEVRTSGAAGSGATGLFTSGSTTAPTVSANLTALTGGTSYSYYIRSDCGDGDYSVWSSAGTFTTLSCSVPTAVTSSAITTSTATIAWTAPATGSPIGYEYEVRTSGAAGSGATGLIASGTTTAPTVSASLNALTAATSYSVYIRTNCYSGFNSSWTSAVTFATLCNSITTFPFTESFQGITTGIPTCWGIAGTLASSSSYHFSSSASGQTGRGLIFNSFSSSSGSTSELITPTLDLSTLTTAELKFYFKNPTGGNFEVLISTDNGVNYTSLQSSLTGQTAWLQKTYTITSYISSTVKIKFKGTSNYGSGDAYVYLDEIIVQAIPSCLPPSTLVLSSITNNSASLSWTAPATAPAAGYEVYYSTTNTAPVTGTIASASVASGTTYAFNGLTASTTYYSWVRSNCGDGDVSTWVASASFTTLCDAVSSFPITQGFNSSTIPSCWSQQFVSGSLSFAYPTSGSLPTVSPQEGSNMVYYNSYSNSTETRLVSLPFNSTSQNSLDVEYFWYHSTDGGSTSYLTEGVTLQYSLDRGTTWTSIGSQVLRYDATAGWKKYTVTLPNAAINQSTVTIGFLFKGNSGYNSYLDNVSIKVTPNTWTGTTSNSWNTASNWSLNTVPTASDDILISSNGSNPPVMDVDVTIPAGKNLTLTGGRLTIAPGKVLTIAGTANFGGRLVTFESNATGTAMLGILTGTLTGATNVKVERFIPSGKRAFRLLSPAVTTTNFISGNWQGQTHITGGASGGFDATETNNPSMYTYNNQVASGSGWTPILNTNATNLTAGVGYRMLVRGDRTATNITTATTDNMNAAITLSATGTLKTGTVALNASSTPAINNTANTTTADYSLVGNPYQSAVDWNAITKSGIDASYYAWDPNMGTTAQRGRYVVFNGTTNDNVLSQVGQFIQPGQAFFVKNTTPGTAGTLTFQEAHKATTNANVFRTVATPTLAVALYDPNELAIGGYPIDATKAVFSSDYSNELGLGDATKLEAAGENIAWFRNNTKLAIDAAAPVTTSDELVMKTIRLGANKNYTFKIQTTNFDSALTPYLVDTFLNTQTEISTSQAHLASFATTSNVASYSENRFKVVFQNAVLSTDTFASQVGLYPNPSKGNGFYLQLPSSAQATVKLYNTIGQEIGITNNSGYYQANQSLAAGVYHIMVTQGEKTSKLKWIVE